MANRLVRYFPDADLRAGYDGLSAAAKKEGVNLMGLPKGHFVGFMNRERNKLKLCAQNDLVAYLRLSKGKIDPRVISTLPEYFNGGSLDYDGAVRSMLKNQFPQWFEKNKP
jgi:hypothetical protein